jgi:cytochrome c-type biogenesis protein CcmH
MRRLAAFAGVWLALAPAAALACPQTSLGDIEDEVMCPVCGTSLGLATEAPQAQRERAFIEGLIAQCKSKDEVKAALAAEFGDEVLALPDDSGFGLAAYLIPAAILLAASGAIAVGVRRWRRAGGAGGDATDGGGVDRAGGANRDAAGVGATGVDPNAAGAPAAGARADSKRLDDDLARYDL